MTGWRPLGRRAVVGGWSWTSLGAPRSVRRRGRRRWSGRARRARRRAARWRRVSMPPWSSPKSMMSPGPLTRALTSTSRPAGTRTSSRPMSPRSRTVRPSRAAGSRTVAQVEHQLAGARSGSCPARRRRAPGVRRAVSALPVVGGGGDAQRQAGDQADQDQPAGASVEGADQQHRADGGRPPGRGTPRRRPAPRPGRRCRAAPTPRATRARVNQKRIGPRRRGSRGTGWYAGSRRRAAVGTPGWSARSRGWYAGVVGVVDGSAWRGGRRSRAG